MAKTTYKVGDKVRILDAKKIKNVVKNGFKSGEVYPVTRIYDDGRPVIEHETDFLAFFQDELKYIEKVEESDAKMTQFKVGDKVRVINADGIKPNAARFKNGEIAKVTGSSEYGVVIERKSDGKSIGVWTSELGCIELVSPKPTKNQRISALEKEVETLKVEIEALKAAQKPPVTVIADAIKRYKECTPNEQASANEKRKAIIDEAKAFVEKYEKACRSMLRYEGDTGNGIINNVSMNIVFEVNVEKRAVTALFYARTDGILRTKGIAKCNPSDVFNEHIGKAIALGSALGLDVSKFEKAAQPSEVVVGHIIDTEPAGGSWTATVTKLDDSRAHNLYGKAFQHSHDSGWLGEKQVKVIDDTEAQY